MRWMVQGMDQGAIEGAIDQGAIEGAIDQGAIEGAMEQTAVKRGSNRRSDGSDSSQIRE